MRNKVFVTDIDDCVLQWKEGFFKFLKTKGWHQDPTSKCDSWNIWTWICDSYGEKMDKVLAIEYITEFNGYPRVLKPLQSTQFYLPLIKSQGFDIIGLTSFGGCPIQTKFRQEYLDVLFPNIFKEVIVLPLGACKNDALLKLKPDYFIEDNRANADKACDLGIKTLLLSTSYNQGSFDSIYVNNWEDIYCIVVEDLDPDCKYW